MKKTAFLVFLLLTVVSGCSALSNSESFYRDHPEGRTRWREYTD
jgi:Prokaryotic membrane lipoprotein lipid attachment site